MSEPKPSKPSLFVRVAAIIILILMFLMMATCLIPLAHGTTTRPRANSLGLSQTYQNPMSYMFGSVEHIDAFSKATNVVFKPFGASMLDTEPILFCGNIEPELMNATNKTLFIVTYRRQPSRMYDGVACHEVYRIIEVQ